MNCFKCNGTLEDKKQDFITNINNKTIYIKDVPSQVCEKCKDISYNNKVARQLEKLVDSVKNSNDDNITIQYMN